MIRRLAFAAALVVAAPLPAGEEAAADQAARSLKEGAYAAVDLPKRYFDAMIRRDPKNARAWFHRARCHLMLDRPDAARADVEAALKANPKMADALALRAEIAVRTGHPDQAEADVAAALAINPKFAPAIAIRAEAALAERKYDRAVAVANEALKIDAMSAVALYVRGMAKLALQDEKGGVEDLKASAGATRIDGRAAAKLGEMCEARGDPNAAIGYYATAQRQRPQDLELYRRYFRLGEGVPFHYMPLFSAFPSMYFPNSAELAQFKARLLESEDYLFEALTAWDQAIGSDGTRPDWWVRRGELKRKLADYAGAAADFASAAKLDPKAPAPPFRRAVALRLDKRYADAEAAFAKAVELDPRSAAVRYESGLLARATDKPDKAVAEFTVALRLDPRSVSALRERGLTYLGLRQDAKALADLGAAVKLDPLCGAAWVARGGILSAQGKKQEALEEFSSALKHDPDNLPALRARVTLLQSLGRDEEANGDSERIKALAGEP